MQTTQTMQIFSDEKVIHSMNENNAVIGKVKNGETFVVETRSPGIPDEVFEKDYNNGQEYPKRVLSITGPIEVEGAEPGDILEINIEDINFDTWGKMWMGQWMGILMDEVDTCYLKRVEIEDNKVVFNENIRIPFRPMIGTLGVAPKGEDIPCLTPGLHGANMDVPTVAPGNKLFLEVQVPGALVAVGDVHAAMGDAEILGTGVEIGSKVTLAINILKEKKADVPLVETPNTYELVYSHADMFEASKGATREAIKFVQNQLGLSFEEAYALVGQTGNLKVAQVVNPIYTLTMGLPKYLFETQIKGGKNNERIF